MKVSEFVDLLEASADPVLVEAISDWSTENKLYMYLHNKQLTVLDDIKKLLETNEAKMG